MSYLTIHLNIFFLLSFRIITKLMDKHELYNSITLNEK